MKKNFLDNLSYIEKNIEDCIPLLKEKLNFIAEVLAKEIIESIKKEIIEKVKNRKYKIKDGKKVVEHFHTITSFGSILKEKKFVDKEIEQKINEYFTLLEKCKTYKHISELCDYELRPTLIWTSSVKKHLYIRHHILGLLSFGFYYGNCFFDNVNAESSNFSQERIFKGTIKFDYLTGKLCNLIKKKLRNEGIIFKSFTINLGVRDANIDGQDMREEFYFTVTGYRQDASNYKKGEKLTGVTVKCEIIFT